MPVLEHFFYLVVGWLAGVKLWVPQWLICWGEFCFIWGKSIFKIKIWGNWFWGKFLSSKSMGNGKKGDVHEKSKIKGKSIRGIMLENFPCIGMFQ